MRGVCNASQFQFIFIYFFRFFRFMWSSCFHILSSLYIYQLCECFYIILCFAILLLLCTLRCDPFFFCCCLNFGICCYWLYRFTHLMDVNSWGTCIVNTANSIRFFFEWSFGLLQHPLYCESFLHLAVSRSIHYMSDRVLSG